MVDYLLYMNVGLTLIGVIILLISMNVSRKFKEILTANDYRSYQWLGVQILILFFAIAYTIHGVTLGDLIELPIDLTTLVTLVYFFGGIFVIVTMLATNNMIVAILGQKLSDKNAIDMFIERFGIEEKIDHLSDQFEVNCSFCKKNINYSVADVVRSHAKVLDRGMSVVSTFGVRSFILRPSHKCKEGRREMTIIHDSTLAFRAVDNSRLIAGEDF
ncbi:MAG: hypothetical protein GPJ54_10480 [Candidatus Heimdallarchaeota archaeon]|nr:hypothetical protein [Candidatus Heimdallarchaeota archaeon]